VNSNHNLDICTSPYDATDSEFLEAVVAESARAYVEQFCERNESLIEQHSDGLVSMLRNWAASPADFQIAWNPVFGFVRSAVSPVHSAVALALHLNSHGVSGEWNAHVEEPARFLCGSVLLPPAVELSTFRKEGVSFLTLVTLSGTRTRFCLDELPGRHSALNGASDLFTTRMESYNLSVLTRSAIGALPPISTPFKFTRRSMSSCIEACREAIEVLRTHANQYLIWVDRAMRYVLPIHSPARFLRSASEWGLPGVVQMSFNATPVSLAEMLVHESSHQYFHMVQRYEATHDPNDTRLYYSPLKGTGRPAEMILLGFHAFANVVLFYRACMDNGFYDDDNCRAQERRHLSDLKTLAEQLRTMDSLTASGRRLWEPLAARLF